MSKHLNHVSQEFFSSKELKFLMGVSDCELMHLRSAGKLKFIKKGNAFIYQRPDKKLLMKHPLANQLINWYQEKHPIALINFPKEEESINSVISMLSDILLPIYKTFGNIKVTYGFVSAELNKYIQKNSSSGTYPSIDQHSASELNSANTSISKRHGLACDFVVEGYETHMNKIMHFIVENLNYDKIYYYGSDRPLHVSIGNQSEKHLQVMNLSDKGRRIPGKKAYGIKAVTLAEELLI